MSAEPKPQDAGPTRPAPAGPTLKIGDWVKIRNFTIKRGKVIELRGPLAPGGVQVYSVQISRRPPRYVELREDQVELIPRGE